MSSFGRGAERSERDREAQRADNRARSVQRSASVLKRIVRFHNLVRLMTFTNGAEGEGWHTRKEALDTVARFIKVHGQECFGSVKLVMIAERGGKGARWHVHALMPHTGWLPYSRIIRCWSAFMERQGYHSTANMHRWHAGDDNHKHADGFSSARVAARYAAKYLTKDMVAEDYGSGVHRYRTAGGAEPIRPQVSYAPSFPAALAELGHDSYVRPIEVELQDGSRYLVGYYFDGGG